MTKLAVLVVGATGRQGSAVTRALLAGGHDVRALTEDLGHPTATALRLRGARLAWASLDDERHLADALSGMDTVVAVAPTTAADPALEVQRGLLLAELVRAHGVPHLVCTSSMFSARITGVAHLDSKHEIEQYIRAIGIPHTIVCPAFYMETLLTGRWLDCLRRGELSIPLSAGRKLQQITRQDTARFLRHVVERREQFLGRRICIAADELTPLEMAATLARASGQAVRYVLPDPAMLRDEHPGVAASFDVMERANGCADVVGLRNRYPEVNWHTLNGWATRQEWGLLRA